MTSVSAGLTDCRLGGLDWDKLEIEDEE